MLGQAATDRRAAKLAQQLTEAKDMMKGPKLGKLVKVKRNPFHHVLIKCFEVQMKFNPWLDDDILLAAKEEAEEVHQEGQDQVQVPVPSTVIDAVQGIRTSLWILNAVQDRRRVAEAPDYAAVTERKLPTLFQYHVQG